MTETCERTYVYNIECMMAVSIYTEKFVSQKQELGSLFRYRQELQTS